MKKINKKIMETYHRNGWVKLEKFISVEQASLIKIKIDKFFKKNIVKYSGRDINFSKKNKNIYSMNSFHKLIDINLIKDFGEKKKIKTIVSKFLNNKKAKLQASELFAKPALHGLASPEHQDNYYWNVKNANALTVWIALDKSSKSNGGIYYYNKSHKCGVVEHKMSFMKGSSQRIKNSSILKKFKKIFPKLNVGDALFHHCNVIHGSGKNYSNKNRKGCTLQYKQLYSKYDQSKRIRYLKELKSQISYNFKK